RSGKSQSGASGVATTMPAFAPISVVMPASVMRSPCGSEPAPWNSTHAYRAPSVPISRTPRMIASFIVTPLRGFPVKVTLMDSGIRSQVRPSASATAMSVAPTPSSPRPRSPAITASITESWTMTRDTGAITRSPECASRPDARERIFSASVLGNDPLPQQRVQLIHRERAGVGQGLDPTRDLLELIFAEFEPELFRAVVDRVLAGEPVRDVDRSRQAEVGRVEDFVGVGVEID